MELLMSASEKKADKRGEGCAAPDDGWAAERHRLGASAADFVCHPSSFQHLGALLNLHTATKIGDGAQDSCVTSRKAGGMKNEGFRGR